MVRWTTGTGALALAVIAGTGLAGGPVVSAQKESPRDSVRVVQLFGGASWIGVSISDIAADDAAKATLPAAGGVMVDEVTSDSPAAAAGVKRGDVIVEFDGERVRSTRQLTRLVQETPAGRKVQCSVMREGQRVPLTIEPRESDGMRALRGRLDDFDWAMPVPPTPPAPPAPPARPAPPVPPAPPAPFRFFDYDFDGLLGLGAGRLGVTVNELQPQLAEFFGTKEGVLVTSVAADSTAAKAGVKAGDVITAINGEAVTSASELRRRTTRLEDGTELTLGVVRDKKGMTLKGKVETSTARRRTHTVL